MLPVGDDDRDAMPMRHAVHDTSESRPLDCESILRDVPDGAPVGLIAGWGRFPICVAEKLKALGHPVHCVAITGHAGEELNEICESVLWSGVGRFGGHLRYFKRNDVAHVTMAANFSSQICFTVVRFGFVIRRTGRVSKPFGPACLALAGTHATTDCSVR